MKLTEFAAPPERQTITASDYVNRDVVIAPLELVSVETKDYGVRSASRCRLWRIDGPAAKPELVEETGAEPDDQLLIFWQDVQAQLDPAMGEAAIPCRIVRTGRAYRLAAVTEHDPAKVAKAVEELF